MATTKKITMREFNGTDYDTLYPKTIVNQVDNALNKTGDTMTGILSIEHLYPAVRLKQTGNGDNADVTIGTHNLQLKKRNVYNDDNNYRRLILSDSAAKEIKKMLQISDRSNGGTEVYYDVLHTGNLEDLSIAKIVTGSYVGTGTYGASNPCKVSLPFTPKAFFILPISESDDSAMRLLETKWTCFYKVGDKICGVANSANSGQAGYSATVTISGNMIEWYSTSSAGGQGNGAGKTYNYIALG